MPVCKGKSAWVHVTDLEFSKRMMQRGNYHAMLGCGFFSQLVQILKMDDVVVMAQSCSISNRNTLKYCNSICGTAPKLSGIRDFTLEIL